MRTVRAKTCLRRVVTVGCLWVCALTVSGCEDVGHIPAEGSVSARVGAVVREQTPPTLALQALTPFVWTEVHIYGPYRLLWQICGALPSPWTWCWFQAPVLLDDTHQYLVFLRGTTVVHAEHHLRFFGDFAGPLHQRFSAETARFSVVETPPLGADKPWYELRPIPPVAGEGSPP